MGITSMQEVMGEGVDEDEPPDDGEAVERQPVHDSTDGWLWAYSTHPLMLPNMRAVSAMCVDQQVGSVQCSPDTKQRSPISCYFFINGSWLWYTNWHTSYRQQIKEHNGYSEKGDKVLCLLQLGVLPLSLWGGGVRRCYSEKFFIVAPDSPSPSACRLTSLVWSTMAFDPTPGKTQRR